MSFKTNFYSYLNDVKNNPEYIHFLNEELSKLTIIVKKISKEYYNNKMVTELSQNYYDISIDFINLRDSLIDLIKQRPNGFSVLNVLWFLYFEVDMVKKLKKDKYHSLLRDIRNILLNMGNTHYSSIYSGIPITKTNNNSTYNYRVLTESEVNSVQYHSVTTLQEIFSAKKAKKIHLDNIFSFVIDNIQYFPTSTQKELKKVGSIKKASVTEITNEFQMMIYIENLPEKLTMTFLTNELSRLTAHLSRDETIKSHYLFFRAVIEKYGLEKLTSFKTFFDLFHKKIISNPFYTNIENYRDTYITPDIEYLILQSTLKSLNIPLNQTISINDFQKNLKSLS